MKEKLKQFVGAKRGVSPVIGVVLMVAVVVILAAVIGAFVLGLGGDQSSAPQASFSMDGQNVVYEGGDSIEGSNIKLTLDGAADGISKDTNLSDAEITAGSTVGSATTAGTVRVVYTGNGKSTTIWKTDYDGSGGTA